MIHRVLGFYATSNVANSYGFSGKSDVATAVNFGKAVMTQNYQMMTKLRNQTQTMLLLLVRKKYNAERILIYFVRKNCTVCLGSRL